MKKLLLSTMRILTQKPNSPNALGRKGLTLYDVGMLEEAVTYFDRVLDIESNNTLALYYKALALDKLGKYNEAITVRDKL